MGRPALSPSSMENIAEYLFRRRSAGCGAVHLAEVLGSIGWIMEDDGAEIAETLRLWLEKGDRSRVEVALAYTEGLFRSENEAERLLHAAASRWPELREKCEEALHAWARGVSR